MKKLFTLFAASMLFTAVAQAQTAEDARDVILGKKKRTETKQQEENRTSRYPTGSREAEADRINREYDQKIQSIRNNNTLSAEEKSRMIEYLEKEREKELKRVNKDGRKYEEGDRDDRNAKNKKDKQFKNNRGKHKGWEKGKGNKHRDRDND